MDANTELKPIVVVAEMRGPLVLNNPLHLDGLLLAAREKRDGIESRGTPFTALARTGDVFNASAGILVVEGIGGAFEDKITRTRRLDMKRDGEWIAFPENATKAERTIGSMSPYRPTMETQRVVGNVRQVVWQAVGDAAEIEDLLGFVGTLGRQHKTGWGEVERFEILPSEADPSTCGLAAGGKAVRNLPVGMARDIGVETGQVLKGRLEPPYALAEGGAVDVFAPTLAQLTMSEEKARETFLY